MALEYNPDEPLDNSTPYNPELLQQIEAVKPDPEQTPILQPTPFGYQEKKVTTPGQPDDYVPEQATVRGQVKGILQEGSPLLQTAQTRAKHESAQRGLLNTSMASTAGTKAAIDTALQIATPDAQTYKEASARKQTTDYQGSLNEQQAKLQMQNTLQQAVATGDINKQQAVIKNIQDTQQAKITALLDREKLDAGLRQTLMQDIGTAGSALTTSIEYILRDPDLDAEAKTAGIQVMTERYEANVDTAAALAGVELTWS